MSDPKWSLTIEDVRGVFVILVRLGRNLEGTGTADDFEMALEIGKELYGACRDFRKEPQAHS